MMDSCMEHSFLQEKASERRCRDAKHQVAQYGIKRAQIRAYGELQRLGGMVAILGCNIDSQAR